MKCLRVHPCKYMCACVCVCVCVHVVMFVHERLCVCACMLCRLCVGFASAPDGPSEYRPNAQLHGAGLRECSGSALLIHPSTEVTGQRGGICYHRTGDIRLLISNLG